MTNYKIFSDKSQKTADDCFYRGGLYNWFEGGPVSGFLPQPTHGSQPTDGDLCANNGRYIFILLILIEKLDIAQIQVIIRVEPK